MFNKWQQVEEWITDNGFKRWIFYKNNPETRDAERANDKVIDSKFYPGTLDEKLALTKKHMEQWGAKLYGVAYQSETATTGGCVCEVRLEAETPAAPLVPQMPVGSNIDEDALRARIKRELETEWERKAFEHDKQAFEKDKREFEKVKSSAIGLIVQQFAPYMDNIVAALGKRRMVAGLDAEDPEVRAARIVAEQPEAQAEHEEPSPFTDGEADELFELMARFKKVEPNYLALIKAVVEMAESGDGMYATAKKFLVK